MKMLSTSFTFKRLATGLVGFVICFPSLAQDDLSALDKKLQEQRIKAESVNANAQQELSDIEAQKAKLLLRQNEITEANAKTLIAVKEDAPLVVLDTVMMKSNNFGVCQVTRGQVPGEYYIKGTGDDKSTIRFHFADEHSLFKPVATPYPYQGLHLMQIVQDGFSPADNNKKGKMSATIRFNDELKVVHAVFEGELLYDQMLGFNSSFTPSTLTCLIM